ncbi:MAG: hypothetical protein ACRCT8_00940 [Lacipirellulaceae bacterium]
MRWQPSLALKQSQPGWRCALAAVALLAFRLGAYAAEVQPLRVALDRTTLVYPPGDALKLTIDATPPGVEPGGAFDFEVALGAGRDGALTWRGETTRETLSPDGRQSIDVVVPLPIDEGVYRVVLRATRPAGFTKRFMPSAAGKPLAERSFQVLVVDPARRPGVPSEWRESHALNPASPRWRDRLPTWTTWRRLSWIEGGAPGSLPGGPARVAGSPLVELPPAPTPGDAHWQAYPLPVTKPGATCLVEVELDFAQRSASAPLSTACLAVFDADTGGALRPLGEGVVVEAPRWNAQGSPTVVRLACRPRTNTPLLVVANPNVRAALRYGAVRVLQASSESPTPTGAGRHVALDWRGDDLPTAVGASLDPSGEPDLASHFEAATIAAERVALAGATTALVPIDAASCGYPANNATTSAAGDDLPAIDPLAITLAEFDRRGLAVVPVIRFEADRSVLEPPAQQDLAAAMDRLVTRCESSPAFAGVAVRLGGDELLRGDDEGYDTATVDRFLATLSKRWPEGAARSPDAHAAAIRAGAADEWARYRYAQCLAVQAPWRSRVEGARPDGVGLLAIGAVDLLASGATPRLARGSGVEELLRSRGVIAAEAGGGSLPIAAPRAVALAAPLADYARGPWLAQEVRQELEAAFSRGPSTSVELTATPLKVRLLRSGPLIDGAADAPDLTVACVAAPMGADQQALAETIAAGCPATVIDATAARAGLIDARCVESRRLLASLTRGVVDAPGLTTPASRGRDVTIEAYSTPDATFIVAVNTTPWSAEAQATINTPQRCLATSIGAATASADGEWYEAGSHAVQMALAPHQAIAWRFASKGIEPGGVRERFPAAAGAELGARIDDVKSRDRTRRRPYDAAPNPSFESIDALAGPVGWRVDGSTEPPLTGDKAAKEGTRTLVVPSTSSAGIACEPFPLPATGQLAATFWARGRDLSPDAELQLSIEQDGGPYRVETRVPAAQIGAGSGDAWQPVLFAVGDLPLDAAGKIRLRFAVRGEGSVEVDDLRLEDLMLPLEEYAADLRTQKLALVKLSLAAETALAEGRLGDARRIVDGYWARFVTEHFPPQERAAEVAAKVDPQPVEQTADAAEPTPSGDAESPSSITERMKRLLWRPWR